MVMPIHGGSDSGPPIAHDFSSNANPLGPPPELWAAVLNADRQRYPDPNYAALRTGLAEAHGLSAAHILPASGGAEAIRRLTLAAWRSGIRHVWAPAPGFGDYAAAATALGLQVHGYANAQALVAGLQAAVDGLPSFGPALVWVCEPCNPTGASLDAGAWAAIASALNDSASTLVIDQAYEPLRLDGVNQLPTSLAQVAWRLQCPNKALGLTGVRAAYLLAPQADSALLAHAQDLAPSWVLSAEGVALLQHWHSPVAQQWLGAARLELHQLRAQQQAELRALACLQSPSCTPFYLAQLPPWGSLAALRAQGIKLRDAHSFGLPGWVRISTQTGPSQKALFKALKELQS